MFSRSYASDTKCASAAAKPLEGLRSIEPRSELGAQPPPLPPTVDLKSFSAGSVIGSDLTIMGQGLRIVSRGTLQVDGKIEGDVVGSEVIIGEKGHVKGIVSGENVVVRGEVSGTIKALKVALQSSARVEGDVHHNQLSVEQGAHLDGRVRRPQDAAELAQSLETARAGGA